MKIVLKIGLSALALVSAAFATPAIAQNITAVNDGTGTQVDFDAATQTYTINGGTQVDANLFHSFQRFGLSAGEIANFLANPEVANVLARVTGGSTSVINGLLQVSGGNNANLFVLNPAGILLGRNASLNLAGSFSASTASGIAFGDQVFSATGAVDYSQLTGSPSGYAFLGGEGILLNEADLAVAAGEQITLAGSEVVNTGSLSAPGGKVSIVAVPETGMLQISQDGLILSLGVPAAALADLNTADISALDLPALLAGRWGGHATTVQALPDGTVALTRNRHSVDLAPGAVTLAGSLNVSGEQGGQVQVLGTHIALDGADVSADGAQGGGTVLIGGEYLGQGSLPTAQTTTVDSASRISADALTSGDGGRVIVWADQTTHFGGQISARGGVTSGNGGFVETSGGQTLGVDSGASVDTRAPNGDWGTWLLDPTDLEIIATGGTANIVGNTNSPTAASTLGADTLVNALNGTNVTLQASNSITVNAAVDASGNAADGDLAFATPTANLNQRITLRGNSQLSGTATTVNVGANGSVQNGVDVVASNGTVNLAAATFEEGATISIDRPLTLSGAGAGNTILSGENAYGVLSVAGVSNDVVNIDSLTIEQGDNRFGGGIYVNDSQLSLANVTLSNNTADFGGGLFSEAGSTVTVTDSTLSSNTANNRGGGIYGERGTLTVTNSTLSGNAADQGGGMFNFRGNATVRETTLSGNTASNIGGGIVSFDSSSLTIVDATLSGNTATNRGGSIFNEASNLTVTNSTLSGNEATNGNGGAIFHEDGNLTVNNATVAFNTAANGQGGGVFITGGGTRTLRNSILAGNTGSSRPDISGPLDAVNNSLIGSSDGISGSVPSNGVDGNLVGQDPQLDPLADNGGPTQTHALQSSSPAIDGSGSGATATDQRGVTAVATRDIGAFEFTPPPPPPASNPTAAPAPPVSSINIGVFFNRLPSLNVRSGFGNFTLVISPALAQRYGLQLAPANPPGPPTQVPPVNPPGLSPDTPGSEFPSSEAESASESASDSCGEAENEICMGE